jgi:NAD(P)-dependent dehydrogenase (short-subunit alcohol dehydrogenase family)
MTRVVLVTGATRGIGQELARQLARRGDTVVLTARDLAKAERAAAALPARERVLVRRLDVTNPASIQQVAADLEPLRPARRPGQERGRVTNNRTKRTLRRGRSTLPRGSR